MVIIAQASKAAAYTLAAQAASTTSTAAIFLAASGQPGAGAQLRLNLPGSSKLNGKAFRLIASGLVQLGAGPYTATVQPLVYCATTDGFTAGVTNAILSSTAVTVVGSGTTTLYCPWNAEIMLTGNQTSGTVTGAFDWQVNRAGTLAVTADTVINNAPTSVDMSANIPLQFSAGVTIVGAISSNASAILTLTDLHIEG